MAQAAEGTGRFDYVRYDDKAQAQQDELKKLVVGLGEAIDRVLKPGRERSLAQTKLEEVYMRIGRAVRDEQVERNGSAPLEEARGERGEVPSARAQADVR